MKILGIIPARGGSKSIPNKNIVALAGHPLLFYTCKAAKKSKTLTRVIVSTDDAKIASYAEKFGVEVPFIRPKKLAKDSTPALPVIKHALEYLQRHENYKPDIIVLLQPTSPLRTAKHIDAAVKLLLKTKADSVVSVVRVPHQFNPFSVMSLKKGLLSPFIKSKMILRRQDKPLFFGRNGPAVLAMQRKTILEQKSLYGCKIAPLIMLPEESVDIDTQLDLKIAEFLVKCCGL